MAYVKIHSISNVWGRLKYVFDDKAHDGSSHRVLATSGNHIRLWGGNRTPYAEQSGFYLNQQFKNVRHLAKNPAKKCQAQHLIVSFDEKEFSTKSSQLTQMGAKRVNQLVNGYMMQHFSDDQWVCGVQCDGAGHKLHAHVIINAVKPDGRCVRTNKFKVKQLRDQWDDYLNDNYLPITGHAYVSPYHHHQPRQQMKAHGWKGDLIQQLAETRQQADSLTTFLLLLRKRKITVTERNRKGDWTYHVNVKGKRKSVRDYYQRVDKQTGQVLATRGIGHDYTPDELKKYFATKVNELDKEIDTDDKRTQFRSGIQEPVRTESERRFKPTEFRSATQQTPASNPTRPPEPEQRPHPSDPESEPETGPEL